MEDKVIHDNYKELACAIIEQAVTDWLGSKDSGEYAFYKWMKSCDLFDYLNLDREWFFKRVVDMKRRKVRKLRVSRYGKAETIV